MVGRTRRAGEFGPQPLLKRRQAEGRQIEKMVYKSSFSPHLLLFSAQTDTEFEYDVLAVKVRTYAGA